MRAISLVHLSTLVCVVRHGPMTGAAQALGYSVSAVSGHVSRLERQLRVDLVERANGRVRPTLAGVHVVRVALEILDAQEEIFQVGERVRRPGGPVRARRRREGRAIGGATI
jgi:DNA-binding transcriptional LysR family regulator